MTDLDNTIRQIAVPDLKAELRDMGNHNLFFAHLYCAMSDLYPFSPVGKAIKKAYDAKDYLELGRLICEAIDEYERENVKPLDDSEVKRE